MLDHIFHWSLFDIAKIFYYEIKEFSLFSNHTSIDWHVKSVWLFSEIEKYLHSTAFGISLLHYKDIFWMANCFLFAKWITEFFVNLLLPCLSVFYVGWNRDVISFPAKKIQSDTLTQNQVVPSWQKSSLFEL